MTLVELEWELGEAVRGLAAAVGDDERAAAIEALRDAQACYAAHARAWEDEVYRPERRVGLAPVTQPAPFPVDERAYLPAYDWWSQ